MLEELLEQKLEPPAEVPAGTQPTPGVTVRVGHSEALILAKALYAFEDDALDVFDAFRHSEPLRKTLQNYEPGETVKEAASTALGVLRSPDPEEDGWAEMVAWCLEPALRRLNDLPDLDSVAHSLHSFQYDSRTVQDAFELMAIITEMATDVDAHT